MTKNILILEGDHVSIKKTYIFTREILKKGFVQNCYSYNGKTCKDVSIYLFFLLFLWNK